jgi:hypothetical protein
MKFYKTITTSLSALLFGLAASNAFAITASNTTTVTVTWPEVLILYTFDAITIEPDAAFMTNDLTFSDTCTAGTGECESEAAPAASNLPIAGAATSVDAAGFLDSPDTSALLSIEIENAIGVRSLGSTAAYTLGVTESAGATSASVAVGTGQLTSIPNTGLTLSTGSLFIDIDRDSIVNGEASTAQEFTIQVTTNP